MKITIIPKTKSREPFLELYPPKLANEFLPDWYKKMELGSRKGSWIRHHLGDDYADERDIGKGYTAKKCPAIQDVITSGIVIPLWGKMYIGHEYDDEGKPIETHYAFTGDQFTGTKSMSISTNEHHHITTHNPYQTEYMDVGTRVDGAILKIELPYKIIVPEGYNIFYSDPFYHFRNDIRCLTGMVEADKWGYITFPFSIENLECSIEPNTPLIHALIYKREEKLELETRAGTEKEYKDIELDIMDFYLKEKDYRKRNE